MYELKQIEVSTVSGGIENLSASATASTLTGTLIGGVIGSTVALNIAMPTASLFPIWLAACTGAGGAIGSLIGIAFAIGNRAYVVKQMF